MDVATVMSHTGFWSPVLKPGDEHLANWRVTSHLLMSVRFRTTDKPLFWNTVLPRFIKQTNFFFLIQCDQKWVTEPINWAGMCLQGSSQKVIFPWTSKGPEVFVQPHWCLSDSMQVFKHVLISLIFHFRLYFFTMHGSLWVFISLFLRKQMT